MGATTKYRSAFGLGPRMPWVRFIPHFGLLSRHRVATTRLVALHKPIMVALTGLVAIALVSLTFAIAAGSDVSNCSVLTEFDIEKDAFFVRAVIGLQTLNYSYILMPNESRTLKPLLESFRKSIEGKGNNGELTDDRFKKELAAYYSKCEKAVPGCTETIANFSSSIDNNPLLFYYTGHRASWDLIYCAVKEVNGAVRNSDIENELLKTTKLIKANASKSAQDLQKIADGFYMNVEKLSKGFMKNVSSVASKRLSSGILAPPVSKTTPPPSTGEPTTPVPSTTTPPNVNGSTTSEPEKPTPTSRNLSQSLRLIIRTAQRTQYARHSLAKA